MAVIASLSAVQKGEEQSLNLRCLIASKNHRFVGLRWYHLAHFQAVAPFQLNEKKAAR
jgi:hypothetical protein